MCLRGASNKKAATQVAAFVEAGACPWPPRSGRSLQSSWRAGAGKPRSWVRAGLRLHRPSRYSAWRTPMSASDSLPATRATAYRPASKRTPTPLVRFLLTGCSAPDTGSDRSRCNPCVDLSGVGSFDLAGKATSTGTANGLFAKAVRCPDGSDDVRLVEAAGIEPASAWRPENASTCVVPAWFRVAPLQGPSKTTLATCGSRFRIRSSSARKPVS